MPELYHTYPAIQGKAEPCYGGCQTNMSKKSLQRCGCGLVCALDLLLYLHRHHAGCSLPFLAEAAVQEPVPADCYEQKIALIRRRWLPIVYPLGTSGVALAWGLNRVFRKYRLPLRAHWGVAWDKLFETAADMLRRDIPVILAVGQNFPRFWRKDKLKLYRRTQEGEYRFANATHAHFVNLTGIEEEWLQVSSWGKCYYINREEYRQYANRHSLRWLCNILSIQEVN
ncbi:MAG: hypothetical protein IKU72_04355 [Oscillospiraceae bacterium]|nr:hypothetical protein [Oscillospiraceae bacterium]